MVHYGRAETVIGQRRIVLASAFEAHPEQFVRGLPLAPPLPEAAWINKPKAESNKVMLAETMPIPGVVEDGPGTDRRSWRILESDLSNRAGKTDGIDTKVEMQVSHFH